MRLQLDSQDLGRDARAVAEVRLLEQELTRLRECSIAEAVTLRAAESDLRVVQPTSRKAQIDAAHHVVTAVESRILDLEQEARRVREQMMKIMGSAERVYSSEVLRLVDDMKQRSPDATPAETTPIA